MTRRRRDPDDIRDQRVSDPTPSQETRDAVSRACDRAS